MKRRCRRAFLAFGLSSACARLRQRLRDPAEIGESVSATATTAAAGAARPGQRAGDPEQLGPRSGPRTARTPPTLKTMTSSSTSTAQSKPGACRSARWPSSKARPAPRRASAAPAPWSAREPARRGSTCPARRRSKISSPLSFFNAPPVGGKPSLIAHAYETVPAPKTLLVPIAIERIKGPLRLPGRNRGARRSPKATARRLSPKRLWARTFKRAGKRVGFVNAHCGRAAAGPGQRCSFTNGDYFPATLTSPCHTARLRLAARAGLRRCWRSSPRGGRAPALVEIGDLVVRADGGFKPRTLPRNGYAPIEFQGHFDIALQSGGRPAALNRRWSNSIATAGSTRRACRPARPKRSPKPAPKKRGRSAGARSSAPARSKRVIALGGGPGPRQLAADDLQRRRRSKAARPSSSTPARPRPATQTFAIVVPIERRRGAFRYRATLDLPPIAGGLGSITHVDVEIGRRFSVGGQPRSYVSARCTRQHPRNPRPLQLRRRHGRSTARREVLPGQVTREPAGDPPETPASYTCPTPGR